MNKKFYLLICVVFVLGLARGAAAQYTRSWWSDLDATNDWNEPNNWWTMEGENPNWVKSAANSVPDINADAFVGKGGGWQDYPADLNDLIVQYGHTMVDPTIDGNVAAVVQSMRVGGGDDLQGNGFGDPCADHYLTVTGGTLTIGTDQDWEGDYYEWTDWYGWGMFNGQWGSSVLAIGACLSDDVNGTGTMTMSGGVVNVGGHIEVGGWGSVGLLDMTGGEMNIFQGVYCPSSWAGDTGRINLHGGTINARYIRMTDGPYGGNTGIIDVTGGVMTFERDETDDLIYYEDYANVGLYGNAISITSYDANHGEIITDGNYPAQVGKRAALVIDYDVMREGKTTLAAAAPTDPNQAWNPDPPDGALNVKGPPANVRRPILSWSPGDNATSHDVYFGTSFIDVNVANTTSGESKQTAYDPCSWTVDTDLDVLANYYWRIDENPGPVKGDVWNFRVGDLAKALYPSPEDGASDVPISTKLFWTPGIFAVTHDVYFGTSFDDVNDANTVVTLGVSMGNQGPNDWDPINYDSNGLVFSTPYYWRIDEVNSSGIPWKGDTWSLTTGPFLLVDDMDSYYGIAGHEIHETWGDYRVNSTGSEVYLWQSTTDPEFVRDGNSMRFYYKNTKAASGKQLGSKAEADTTDLVCGSNWTIGSIEALSLWFYGDSGNVHDSQDPCAVDQMYIALETATDQWVVSEYYDMSHVKEASWHEWNINLQDFNDGGITLSNVTKMYIGFGGYYETGQGSKGAGFPSGMGDTVYFDDIRLYPRRCVPAETSITDFTGDCITDYDDFEIMADDWLDSGQWVLPSPPSADPELLWFKFDDSGTPQIAENSGALGATYNGQLGNTSGADACDPNWITNDPCSDRVNCLEFGGVFAGEGDHVVSPVLDLNSNDATITAWVKRDGQQAEWAGIVFCRGPDPALPSPNSVSGIGFGGGGTQHDLHYHWDDWWWDFESGLTVPDGLWTFVALVVSEPQATLYIGEGGIVSSVSNVTHHGTDQWDAPTYIGMDPQPLSGELHRVMKGRIDDVRIYDHSLSIEEVLGLAGSTTLVYFPLDSVADLEVGDKDPCYPNVDDQINFKDYSILADGFLKESMYPE